MNGAWSLPLRLLPHGHGDKESDSSLPNRCSHRNRAGHRERMSHSHVGAGTGITEQVTAEVGWKR